MKAFRSGLTGCVGLLEQYGVGKGKAGEWAASGPLGHILT